jgi:hypothetical protein
MYISAVKKRRPRHKSENYLVHERTDKASCIQCLMCQITGTLGDNTKKRIMKCDAV